MLEEDPAEQVLDSTHHPLVSPPAVKDRHIMTRTDFGGSQLPENGGRDGMRNAGLVTIKQPDTAASTSTFCPVYSLWKH
jgi:hypothetical protein